MLFTLRTAWGLAVLHTANPAPSGHPWLTVFVTLASVCSSSCKVNEEDLDSQGPKAQVDRGTMETWAHMEDS